MSLYNCILSSVRAMSDPHAISDLSVSPISKDAFSDVVLFPRVHCEWYLSFRIVDLLQLPGTEQCLQTGNFAANLIHLANVRLPRARVPPYMKPDVADINRIKWSGKWGICIGGAVNGRWTAEKWIGEYGESCHTV